jgi:alanine racemase
VTSARLPRRAWVGIDLGALARNFAKLARHVAPARILAVVKADAYGHGAVEVARTLEPLGAAGFGVATLDEGVALREAGISAPIQVLSPIPDDGIDLLFAHDLTPVVSSLPALRALRERAVGEGKTVSLHLKVDTGMTRLGLDLEELPQALARIDGGSRLQLEGFLSHLAEAEQPDSRANAEQLTLFTELFSFLSQRPEPQIVRHLANSAAALHLPATRFDLVRLGLALHGYDPAGRGGAGLALEPTMSVEAEIVQVREIEPGRRVGYGGRFVAGHPTRIAIVPVGYADGYSWRLGTHAEALVRGRRVPVAGSVSMDLLALDVSATAAEVGDRVTLLGAQGGERITAPELAAHVGSIAYQLLCLFGLRLERRARRSEPPPG